MQGPGLVLFDDLCALDWEPFALTRPVGELRLGTLTLRQRAERVFGLPCLGQIIAGHLASFDEPGSSPAIRPADVPGDRGILYLSSRVLPYWTDPPLFTDATLITAGGEVCGWFVPAGASARDRPGSEFLDDPAHAVLPDLPRYDVDGLVLRRPWELVARNADAVSADIAQLFGRSPPRRPLPEGVHRIGDAPLILGKNVDIEPGVVFDLSAGPVWLDDDVRVMAFSRVAGPTYVGTGSVLLGGAFTSVSIGPACKVHGEMEACIVLGYSNKAHDGFLGHALLGRWVNLGALTSNSDLKNNYGTIRVWTPDGDLDTGLIKFGCLLGDHVKTAIGTLLNTGTVVGAGTNIFGTAPPAKYVPPFTWGTDDPRGVYAMEKFIETASLVMARRKVTLSAAGRAVLREAWIRSRGVSK